MANAGVLLIDRSVIRNNGSDDSNNYIGGAEGGVYNTGSLVLMHSTIQNNYTGVGSRTVEPPGISGGSGGDGAGISNLHLLSLSHCTIGFNSTGAGAPGFAGAGRDGAGGGIFNANTLTATVELKSSLVAGNTAAGEGSTCHGALLSQNYNLLADSSHCLLTGSTDRNIVGWMPSCFPWVTMGGKRPPRPLGSAVQPSMPAVALISKAISSPPINVVNHDRSRTPVISVPMRHRPHKH